MSKLKMLIAADIHARTRAEVSMKAVNGIPGPLADALSVLSQCAKLVQTRDDIGRFAILGDLFHDRKAIDSEAYVRVARALEEFPCPVDIIPGNHDVIESKMITALEALRRPGKVAVYLEPTDQVHGRTLLRWVPYSRSIKTLEASFHAPFNEKWKHPDAKKLILTHVPFNGIPRGPGDYATENSGCTWETLAQLGWVVRSGHFHLRGGPYVGSPMQHNFGDIGLSKGVEVIDLETLAYEFIPLQGPVHAEVYTEQEMEELLAEHEPDALIIRCVIPHHAKPEDVAWIDPYKELVRSLRPKYLPSPAMATAAKSAIASAESDQQMLERFLEIAAPGLPRDRAVQLGLECLGGGQ